MDRTEKHPPGEESDKSREKETSQPIKRENPSIDIEEDELEEQVQEESEAFRACDDKTVEINGLRKFSENLRLERPTVKDRNSASETNNTKDLAYRLRPGS